MLITSMSIILSKYGYYYTFTQDDRHRSYQHEADLNIFGWNDNHNLRANDMPYMIINGEDKFMLKIYKVNKVLIKVNVYFPYLQTNDMHFSSCDENAFMRFRSYDNSKYYKPYGEMVITVVQCNQSNHSIKLQRG